MSILLFLSPLIHTRQKKQPNALRSNNRKPSSCFTFSAIASNPTASLFPQKAPYHTLYLSVKQGVRQTELNILPLFHPLHLGYFIYDVAHLHFQPAASN